MGSRRAAGTSTTIVMWYDWSRGVTTGKSWARAAPTAMSPNATQVFVSIGVTWPSASQPSSIALAAIRIR